MFNKNSCTFKEGKRVNSWTVVKLAVSVAPI